MQIASQEEIGGVKSGVCYSILFYFACTPTLQKKWLQVVGHSFNPTLKHLSKTIVLIFNKLTLIRDQGK